MEIKDQETKTEVEEKEDDFGAAFAEDSEETGAEEKEKDPPTSEAEGVKQEVETEKAETETQESETEKTDGDIDWKAPDAVEKARKVVEDNKSWTTKVTQENAELKKRLEALETEAEKAKAQKPAEKTEAPQAPEIPAEVQTFLEDYPELKPTVEFLAGELVKNALGGIDLKQLVAERERDKEYIGRLAWERDIANGFIDESGTFVEGHSDLYRVVANKDYLTWVKGKGYDKGDVDAKTAIQRITEYKEEVLKKSAMAHDGKVKTEAEKINAAMSGSLKSGAARPSPGKKDEGSFSDGFKDA